MPKTYLEHLREKGKVDGYVMKNESNGVVVNCTEKFVKHWIARGFKIIEQKPVTIIRID